MSDGRRARRVAELVQSHLAQLLTREIDDPSLQAIVVTQVDVPDDMGSARVHVRLMVGDEQEKARMMAMRALRRSASRLRRLLAPRLEMKRVPELRFEYDDGHDKTRRVDELLREIEDERAERAAEDDAEG
ncbi:MAG: 30S ribosome-binding factor RbfA [Polyangiaceae bacterium]